MNLEWSRCSLTSPIISTSRPLRRELATRASLSTTPELLPARELLRGSLDGARREMEVNYLAPWALSRAFAPVLAASGGGVLVNMLSAASWRANIRLPGYAASKAAEWSLTNALRIGLREQGTVVVAVHVGYVDTDATKGLDVPKVSAAEVAEKTMDAIVRNDSEVLVDEAAKRVRSLLSGPLEIRHVSRALSSGTLARTRL